MTLSRRQTTSSADGLALIYWMRPAEAPGNRYLLLVHGGASNHTRWSEFSAHTHLARDWHLLAPDMRGNGETMTRGRQDIATCCGDLVDILDSEGAEDPVIAGHSLGAQIAVNFADRHPDRVRGLILIDPVFQSSIRGRERRLYRIRWAWKALIAAVRGLNLLGLRRRSIPSRDLRELDRETRERIRGADSFEAIEKEYRALGPILRYMPTANYPRQVLETVRPLPPLDKIDVPVLVLLSGGTTIASIKQNRTECAAFRDAEVVVLDANHWPLTETPEAVREAIDGWIARRFGTELDNCVV
ncbi:MAG: alpha/beta hydrolase [Xanthomonadales bacterium]|nr:alpha/beta hydrolase [Xanthomonadales bacterium]